MPTSYENPEHRLRAALNPQTEDEHATVTYLITVASSQLDVITEMVLRRARTAVRAARMDLADEVLQGWQSDNLDRVNRMLLLATGADQAGDVPASGAVADAHQRAKETAGAYDRGFAEGVEHARRQQLAGVDPELWRAG